MGVIIKNTHGQMVELIASKLNLPKLTVESVLKSYTDEIYNILLRGESVVIPRVVSLSLRESNRGLSLKTKSSEYLVEKLKQVDGIALKESGS